jgi:hypothetical protein
MEEEHALDKRKKDRKKERKTGRGRERVRGKRRVTPIFMNKMLALKFVLMLSIVSRHLIGQF